MTSLRERSKEYLNPTPKVVLFVNDKQACNKATGVYCEICYLDYEGVRDPESTLRLVENLRSQFRVLIAGSEVLADIGYLESLKAAEQKYILTNGILLDQNPEYYDLLRENGIEEIQMSFNYKGQKEKSGKTEEILPDVIAKAKEKGFFVRLAVIINQETYQDVEEICAQIKALGADGVLFLRYIKSGIARCDTTETLSEDQKEEFFTQIDAVREIYDKDELLISTGGNFGPRDNERGRMLAEENRYCTAGTQFFVIDPNDKVYGCPYLMGDLEIGELVDESRLEIRKNLCDGDRSCCLTDKSRNNRLPVVG